MTPHDISVLLHFHVSSTAHPRQDAPAWQETIANFIRHGIIEKEIIRSDQPYISLYRTTERGKALVKMLCATPFPVQDLTWRDPRQLGVGIKQYDHE